MDNSQIKIKLNILLSQWNNQVNILNDGINQDLADGLPIAAEMGKCAILSLKGCVNGLERVMGEIN